MTGISAGIHGAKNVVILNATERIGLKILMAGGGRCNITNAKLSYKKFYGESSNAVKKIIQQFPPKKVIELLNKEGLPTKIEPPWNKYFPVSDKAQSVLDTLLSKLKKHGIKIECPVVVESFYYQDGEWNIVTNKSHYICHNLVLACGGFSYPHTGSDGKLWNNIRQLGLNIAAPVPALTPIKTTDAHFHKLRGIAIDCELEIKSDNKVVRREQNPVLFTHTGLSGPGILNLSQWFTSADNNELYLNFLPQINSSDFEQELLHLPYKMKIENFLTRYFPRRFAETLVKITCGQDIVKGELTKTLRKSLLKNIFCYKVAVNGNHGYKKAEVTAGGITFSDLNLKTMCCKNLERFYAVGEIVNVHGDIGGYNFQWAWSSGWVCGKALGEKSFSLST